MIAEEYIYDYRPQSTIAKAAIIACIIDCFRLTVPHFQRAILQPVIQGALNENKLTQIFLEQLKVQLRKLDLAFDVGTQYSDIFFETKGIPDFYFHNLEEGKTSIPLFIVEAKRLPAPEKVNEKEYVKGQNMNGGIERFKIEKHGKGHSECGMLGFVQTENYAYWVTIVNEWIVSLSNSDADWHSDEIVAMVLQNKADAYLTSIVRTISGKNLKMHHFWI